MPDQASPPTAASLLQYGDDQEEEKGRQVLAEEQGAAPVISTFQHGGDKEQGDGGVQKQGDAKKEQPGRNKLIKDKIKTYKIFKMTKIIDYVQEKQVKNSKEGRILEGRRTDKIGDSQVKEGRENPGGGGESRAVKAREELLAINDITFFGIMNILLNRYFCLKSY